MRIAFGAVPSHLESCIEVLRLSLEWSSLFEHEQPEHSKQLV